MMVSAKDDRRRAGTIWMLDLDEPARAVEPRLPSTFQRVGLELMPALASTMGDDASAELLNRFASRGACRCYTAWVGETLASYGWVSFEEEYIGELNLRIKLLPGEAYIWDCATVPAFRRNHLYSALLAHMLKELRAEGLSRVWIGADLENKPSQRGIACAGFHHVADLVVARVLAMRQVWVLGLPGVPGALVAEARRAFLNDRYKVWQSVVTSSI